MKKIRNKGNSLIDFPSDRTIIDIETTGLDPAFDSIIEVGAIKVKDGKPESSFSSLIKPAPQLLYDDCIEDFNSDFLIDNNGQKYYFVDPFITDLTGITNKMLSSAPDISIVLQDFYNFIGNDILIGHNIHFDINFLYDNFAKYLNFELSNDFVDTLRLSRNLHKSLKHHRLSDMVDFYNIEVESVHRSFSDCQATYDLFIKLQNTAIDQFGSVDNFIADFKQKKHTYIDLSSITPVSDEIDESGFFYQKVCCFTGKLEKMTRKEAMQLVVNVGGIIANSVTKKTNYLILGNNDYCPTIKDGKSSKQKKAEKLKLSGQDIEILSENVFYDLINEI